MFFITSPLSSGIVYNVVFAQWWACEAATVREGKR
jgi:hypothetical protein